MLRCQHTIAFHQVNTLNGLSDNNVSNATIDRNGFLWICTTEGLNKYDGRVMKTYYKEDHAALGNNNVREVVCDKKNRLWIRSFGGYISLLDEKRNWHAIHITDAGDTIGIFNIIQTKSKGIVLFRDNKQFIQQPGSDTLFMRWHFADDSVFNQRIYYYCHLSEDEILWTGTNELFIMNYALGKITFRKKITGITSAAAASKNDLYITTSGNGELYNLNLLTGKMIIIKKLRDQYGKPMFSSLQMIRKMADNRMIISSAFAGIYLFDPLTRNVMRYSHDPLNKSTVSGNNYYSPITDTSGYVIITSPTNGLNYFNVNEKPATWIPAIDNEKGAIFDGFVNAFLPAAKPNWFWVAGYNQLIQWNKQTGQATFFEYGRNSKGEANRGNEEVVCLAKDNAGNIWAGTGSNGIQILNAAGKYLRQIIIYSHIKLNEIRINNLLPDVDRMWASTNIGLVCFDTKSGDSVLFGSNHILNELYGTDCGKLWKDSHGRLWIGTARKGAFCYDAASNTLVNFARPSPNSSMEVFAFEEDNNGSIYLGTRSGLLVLKNNLVMNAWSRQNGLIGDRCENLLKDAGGNIWIDNHTCIIRFNPLSHIFTVFDEKSGLNPLGFRPRSAYKNTDGTFFIGNETGFSYFHPDSLVKPAIAMRLSVTGIQNATEFRAATGPEPMAFSSNDNQLVFHVAAVDLSQSKNIMYRYRLAPLEKNWINEPNISTVRYNALNPGSYVFECRASADGINWISASNSLPIIIKPAYWQTAWFRFGAALLLAVIFYIFLKRREKLINNKAEEKAKLEEMRSQALQYQLEIEQVINYFATSLSGLHSVDVVLWDVVKTCISQLGFEDCVIYLYNEERTLLIQKAAYGPKNIDYTDIYNRIEVAPGSGIVGHVALTATPIIIANSANDPRYIPDDAVRLSEIAIPLMGSGGLIGVIDSEHPEANFYTNRHLQILTAIGTMVVNKVEQLQAEANSRNKEVEMARLQRDMATLQLTATRAQMNPHFIFNALNSVQQYILQGNTDEANKYLSKFSRLQREILNHCDRAFISLQKEIEMLRMYLQLEQLRFNGNFEFQLWADEALDAGDIRIPPMILQPFVENAIWHGLMPKGGQRQVTVFFSLDEASDLLHCTITDNGIGRKAAADNKLTNLKSTYYVSKGMSLVHQRLQLLQEQMGRSFSSAIEDMMDESGNPTGTKVEVTMFTGY